MNSFNIHQRLEAPAWRWPDFLGIGVQKSATTWMYENLRRHPRLWMPPVKELQYFNELYIPGHANWTKEHRRRHATRVMRYHLQRNGSDEIDLGRLGYLCDLGVGRVSDDWYGRMFSEAPSDTLCGEITPEYSILPHIGISHVRRLCPASKIIILFRDPIERAWSQIRMILSRDNEKASPPERVAAFPDVLRRGLYPDILDRWSAHCIDETTLVGFNDHIRADPAGFLQRVCEFLRIDFSSQYFPTANQHVHTGEQRQFPKEIYENLLEYYEPTYKEMARRYPDPCDVWLRRHFS